MCVEHSITCTCGKNSAGFHFRDDLLPGQAVANLYCPSCSSSVGFNPGTMITDNGWIIEYDMHIARFLLRSEPRDIAITPEFLFDEGYCTWSGIYPNDHIDSVRERRELTNLAKTEPKRYFQEIRTWGIRRMERLAGAGWRKAHERENIAR